MDNLDDLKGKYIEHEITYVRNLDDQETSKIPIKGKITKAYHLQGQAGMAVFIEDNPESALLINYTKIIEMMNNQERIKNLPTIEELKNKEND